MNEYKRYEFCKHVGCKTLDVEYDVCPVVPELCVRTAKMFHHWLKHNDYKIIKQNKIINVRNINNISFQSSEDQRLKELKNIFKLPGRYSANCDKNVNVKYWQNHFYWYEQRLWKENKNNLRDKLIKNRVKYIFKPEEELTQNDILRGFRISGIHRGFSNHSSLWIKKFIDEFDVDVLLDICGGWGHRLFGALGSGGGFSNFKKYIYNDINELTLINLVQFYEGWFKSNFNINDYPDISFLNNYDASTHNFGKQNLGYSAVFSCPPYFNTEVYFDETIKDSSTAKYPTYNDWLNVWWRNSIKNTLDEPKLKLFAFVINNKYREDMKDVCVQLGLKFHHEYTLGSEKRDHFQHNTKLKKGEKLVIFKT